MSESKLLEESKHYWSTSFHDNEYGRITGLSLSFDEKFLFSVGADSNIFGILFNCSMADLEKAKSDKIKITTVHHFIELNLTLTNETKYSLLNKDKKLKIQIHFF